MKRKTFELINRVNTQFNRIENKVRIKYLKTINIH